MRTYQIALGGLGADSHSVGLTLLRQALSAAGHTVHFMGIHNDAQRFLEVSPAVDVVMMSTLDGHSQLYLDGVRELPRRPDGGPLWYIGGILGIGNAQECRDRFEAVGFDRVYPTPVTVREVLATLELDLADAEPVPAGPGSPLPPVPDREPGAGTGPVDFRTEREQVLASWPTGRQAADLAANADQLRSGRLLSTAQRDADAQGRTLVQPRCGVAHLGAQLQIFADFVQAGANVLSYQIDSLTRVNDYRGAGRGLRDSTGEQSRLNGFPLVNHGSDRLREVGAELPVPLQTRHSTRDPRLLAELSFAAGIGAFEGGCISYNLPYYGDYPLESSIRCWSYVDQLAGWYTAEHGIPVDREFFGPLTSTLIPPCIAVVVNLIEMLLAASQGVRSVSLGYAEQGCREQDIAAVQVLRELGREVADRHGHRDLQIGVVFHQYMAAFPEKPEKAAEIIVGSAETAALARATRILTKSPDEALQVPRPTINVTGLQLVHAGLRRGRRELTDGERARVAIERELILAESRALLAGVLDAGDGDLVRGVPEAFRRGLLDIPFSPSRFNAGRVRTVRDGAGAVRFADAGSLALPAELRAEHERSVRARLERPGRPGTDAGPARREEREPAPSIFEVIGQDIALIADGQFGSWPLR